MSHSDEITAVLKEHPQARRDSLIPILQQIQDRTGFISPQAVQMVSDELSLPTSKIYGVATFYNQFRFQPLGKFHVQVCRGTACHVKGSAAVLDMLIRELNIKPDETTRDGLFSLEIVACIGACGLAPVISVNGEFHGGVTPDNIKKILDSYRAQAQKDQSQNDAQEDKAK
ncbi:MAG: NADH-quinone oxidoreductase subunit NuoE [Sedimentisphaerales bacterium]|nr:NADH-quinone oxidoreductase subunit NuoE [Sedimentisphaerales bacterium]